MKRICAMLCAIVLVCVGMTAVAEGKWLDTVLGGDGAGKGANGGGSGASLQERRAQSPMFQRPQSAQSQSIQHAAHQSVRSVEGMRSMGVRPAAGAAATDMAAASGSSNVSGAAGCPYAVGERVGHPKFGEGEVVRVETLATDHKVVVRFGAYGEKTLLAKFAKLTKL